MDQSIVVGETMDNVVLTVYSCHCGPRSMHSYSPKEISAAISPLMIDQRDSTAPMTGLNSCSSTIPALAPDLLAASPIDPSLHIFTWRGCALLEGRYALARHGHDQDQRERKDGSKQSRRGERDGSRMGQA
jgi:hypothetical protein